MAQLAYQDNRLQSLNLDASLDKERNAVRASHAANPKGASPDAPSSALGLLA